MTRRGERMAIKVCFLAATATLLVARPLAGQEVAKPAVFKGIVSDRSTGAPVSRAEIILLSDSRSVMSDSAGAFVFGLLPAGAVQFVVRRLGFPAKNIAVELAAGQVLDRSVELDSTVAGRRAQQLAAVAVTTRQTSYRLVDFERRRRNGRGQYLTEDQILSSGAYTLQDAVIAMRGVNVDCSKASPGTGSECKIHMVRAPLECSPEYVVDSRVDNMFGPSTAVRDIVGLEVYTGPSDVPGEFAGRSSGCGVVVIWTRSGPTPRRP